MKQEGKHFSEPPKIEILAQTVWPFQNTLSKISNWSPYIFCVSFESKIRLYKINASINRLYETLHVGSPVAQL